MYITTIKLSDEQGEKLKKISAARGMTIIDLIAKFVDTQYEIINEDSEVNQALKDMEQLAKRLETIQTKLNNEKPLE